MAEPLLSIRKMTKRFGGLVAVNEVSWDVYPGEVVGLLGDNGAGKSTLIKCVSGVYQPDEGEIYFEGQRSNFARPIDARRQGSRRSTRTWRSPATSTSAPTSSWAARSGNRISAA